MKIGYDRVSTDDQNLNCLGNLSLDLELSGNLGEDAKHTLLGQIASPYVFLKLNVPIVLKRVNEKRIILMI